MALRLATRALRSDAGWERDGALVVVSADHTRLLDATHVAPTLQHALEQWPRVRPALEALQVTLDADSGDERLPANARAFDAAELAAPLPRAYAWLDGSAYINHVELVRKARGAEVPACFYTSPLMYQGGSDGFLSPIAPIEAADEEWGIDFEGEIGVIVDDVPAGASASEAAEHIRLIVLLNDVSLRNIIPEEVAKGFGFVQGKPPTAFAPVAVTPEALGDAWRDGKLHRPLLCHVNGSRVGWADAGVDMTFSFPELIAHAARTRPLAAGTIIGSGTVSNSDQQHGYSCIAEKRVIEKIADGVPQTPFLRFGDRVRLEVLDDAGRSIFGAIDQEVARRS